MIVDGIELLRMIKDEKINKKTQIKNIDSDLIISYENGVLYYYNERIENDCELFADYSLNTLLKERYEITQEVLTNEEKEFLKAHIDIIRKLMKTQIKRISKQKYDDFYEIRFFESPILVTYKITLREDIYKFEFLENMKEYTLQELGLEE